MSGWESGVKARQEKQAEKFDRYCELRDQGVLPADAALEIGVARKPTGQRYELAYRKARGLPDRVTGPQPLHPYDHTPPRHSLYDPKRGAVTEIVCSACLTQACAAGILFCEDAWTAGIVLRATAKRTQASGKR